MYLLKNDPLRADVPIVVVLYHREEHTRRMFEQLAKVTEGYALIIVNNGFDDPGFIERLNPLHYVENEENTGAIRGMNQGLELAEGKYVAVLHNDILIFEEGWLDHIIEFMEKRPDVGLVGLSGWHSIERDGSIAGNVLEVDREGWRPDQPVWRFTESAAVDGTGWVTRNGISVIDKKYGDMVNGASVDLSLRIRESGLEVHSANMEVTSQSHPHPPEVEAGARKIVSEKWQRLLPVRRGYADEKRFLEKIADALVERNLLNELDKELAERYQLLLVEREQLRSEHEKLKTQARNLEAGIEIVAAEHSQLLRRLEEPEYALDSGIESFNQAVGMEGGAPGASCSSMSGAGRILESLRHNGFVSTVKKSVSHLRKRPDVS